MTSGTDEPAGDGVDVYVVVEAGAHIDEPPLVRDFGRVRSRHGRMAAFVRSAAAVLSGADVYPAFIHA